MVYQTVKIRNRTITDTEIIKSRFYNFLSMNNLTEQYFNEFNKVLNHVNYYMGICYLHYNSIPFFLHKYNHGNITFKYDYPKFGSLLNERIFSNINNEINVRERIRVYNVNFYLNNLPSINPNKSTETFYSTNNVFKNNPVPETRSISNFQRYRDSNLRNKFSNNLKDFRGKVNDIKGKVNNLVVRQIRNLRSGERYHADLTRKMDELIIAIKNLNLLCEDALLPLFQAMNYVFYSKKMGLNHPSTCGDGITVKVDFPSNAHIHRWKY